MLRYRQSRAAPMIEHGCGRRHARHKRSGDDGQAQIIDLIATTPLARPADEPVWQNGPGHGARWASPAGHRALQALSAPPGASKAALATVLTLSSGENDDIILKGASNFAASTFSDGVKHAWISFNLAAFEKEAGRFAQIHLAIGALSHQLWGFPFRRRGSRSSGLLPR